MTRDNKEEFEIEISENENYKLFISPNGEKTERIRYGMENKHFKKIGHPELQTSIFENEYCADCAAKQGEYHYSGCDWEVCPICFSQVLGCNCELKIYYDDIVE